jgi:hypothetical protein
VLNVNHQEIVQKDGPTGMRAALARGPGVWEIVKFIREIDESGTDTVVATAEKLNLPAGRIVTALRYYADHADEIDAQIQQAEAESRRAEALWMARRVLRAPDSVAAGDG